MVRLMPATLGDFANVGIVSLRCPLRVTLRESEVI
jgi:hypothetical protein